MRPEFQTAAWNSVHLRACVRVSNPKQVLVNDFPGSAACLCPLEVEEITGNALINDLSTELQLSGLILWQKTGKSLNVQQLLGGVQSIYMKVVTHLMLSKHEQI